MQTSDLVKTLQLGSTTEPAPSGPTLLVTPDPVAYAQLEKAGGADLKLRHGGVAAKAGRGSFYGLNLRGRGGLHAPTPALKALFPGMRVQEEIEVPVFALADLLADPFLAGSPIRLVIAAGGSEPELLAALESSDALLRVQEIVLHCGEEAFFDGALPRAALEARLDELGFAVSARDDADPDWPIVHLRADPRARALRDLTAQLTSRDVALADQGKALAEAVAKLAAMEAKVTAAAAANAAASADQTKAHEAVAAKLKAAEDKLASVEEARAAAASGLEEKTKALEEKTKAHQAAAAKLKAAEDHGAAQAKAHEAVSAKLKALEEKLASVEEARAAAAAGLEEKAKALEEKTKAHQAAAAKLKAAEDHGAAQAKALEDALAKLADSEQKAISVEAARVAAAMGLAGKTASLAEKTKALEEKTAAWDGVMSKLKAAEEKLAATESARALAAENLSEKTTALAEKTKALVDKTKAFDEKSAAFAEKSKALEEKSAALTGKSKALEEKTTALDAANAQAKVVAEKLTAAEAAGTEKAKALEEKTKAHQDVAAKLKAVEDKAAATEAASAKSLTQVRQQLATAREDGQRKDMDLQMLRRDLGVALRLQDRYVTDLRDLQERFATSDAVRREQEDILRQLTPRLQEAARTLKSLAPDAPALALTAPKGDGRKRRKG